MREAIERIHEIDEMALEELAIQASLAYLPEHDLRRRGGTVS